MRPAKWFGIAALAVMLAAGTAPAYAQTGVKVDIQFPFIVAGRTLPAGTYVIEESSPEMLVVRSTTDVKAVASVVPITRIAQPALPFDQAEVVFDKGGDSSYLSEVWPTGADGFLVYAAKGAHTHARVKGAKK
jgi:hypothetical protein